jgi:hypothetical protein
LIRVVLNETAGRGDCIGRAAVAGVGRGLALGFGAGLGAGLVVTMGLGVWGGVPGRGVGLDTLSVLVGMVGVTAVAFFQSAANEAADSAGAAVAPGAGKLVL